MSAESYESPYYVSPVDGHDHFTVTGRQECRICRLELTAQAALDVLRDFTERVATAAGVSLTWEEADQVGEPGTPKYNDRLICDVEAALRERNLLRGAVAAFRPYRPAIRGNFFEVSPELAEAILRAVAILDPKTP